MALFNLNRWPTILIFLLAGAMAVIFAFVTVNLFSYAMANVKFLREFGLTAIRHGALVQVVELAFWGALSLSCWVVFKICEHLLVDRYLTWAGKSRPSPETGED